jgi:hypothetical protein
MGHVDSVRAFIKNLDRLSSLTLPHVPPLYNHTHSGEAIYSHVVVQQ